MHAQETISDTMEITKEPQLLWQGKAREADILSDTMSLPFQEIKRFGNPKENEWVNKLIFGDNLQALKYLLKLKKEGLLRNPDGTDGIKLVYIDPPFGTGDQYDASGDKPAYSAKLQGAEFIEFLRQRLIFLRELLSKDGSIYVRLDYHFGHYAKIILDEVFGKENFKNELIVKRGKIQFGESSKYTVATDSLFLYTVGQNYFFSKFRRERYEHEASQTNMVLKGERNPRERIYIDESGKSHLLLPPKNTHFKFIQPKLDEMQKKGLIMLKQSRKGIDSGFMEKIDGKWTPTAITPSYMFDTDKAIDSNWTDISGYSQIWDYPTENSEALLERVITTSSNEGDIVLDCFAGSGTTGAVAEKLNRKWIMCDVGKLSIYTIQKRLLNMKHEIGDKGKNLKHKPFVICNVGLYDYGLIEKLGDEEYTNFVLDLFQVDKQEVKINGLDFDGKLFGSPVKVFDRKGFLTEEYVKDMHDTVGSSITDSIFIIAPATNVVFLRTSIEFNGKRYYILKVPYSIIDELHSKEFKRVIQPNSQKNINQIVDTIGFDFIYPPNVERDLSVQDRGGLFAGQKEYVIHIKSVSPIQITNSPVEFPDNLEPLAAVFIDYNYDGKVFNLGKAFFADEAREKGDAFKIKIEVEKCGEHMCVIYLDVLGNEKIEVLNKRDFK